MVRNGVTRNPATDRRPVVESLPGDGQRLGPVVQYIGRHLDRPLTIRELADQACMSESNFYRAFRLAFGQTPVDFINRQRVVRAEQLLRTTDQPLLAISRACGFRHLTYFMKVFRREMGLPPAQYRKQNAG